MFRKHFSFPMTLALAAAVIVLAASSAWAQHGGYHHGGFHHGGYYHSLYPGHYGGYYHHYGHQPSHFYYGPSYYPYSSAYGSLYSPGYYYSPSRYIYPTLSSSYLSLYPPVAVDQVAHFSVSVPADAEIWFNGTKTKSTGPVREFVSPPLASGQRHSYEIQARWTESGQPITQTQEVIVQPGARVTIAFPKKTAEKVK